MVRLRPIACLALLLPALLPVPGCGKTCPAMAWINYVTVALDGDTRDVAWVQLCTPDACSQQTDRPAPPPVLPTATPTPTGANGLGFPPGQGPAEHHISVERTGSEAWRFGFVVESPGSVTVRALDRAGKTLAEKRVSLVWQQIGKATECGGPATAAPVTLTVNAS
jgi:hypothetical protein